MTTRPSPGARRAMIRPAVNDAVVNEALESLAGFVGEWRKTSSFAPEPADARAHARPSSGCRDGASSSSVGRSSIPMRPPASRSSASTRRRRPCGADLRDDLCRGGLDALARGPSAGLLAALHRRVRSCGRNDRRHPGDLIRRPNVGTRLDGQIAHTAGFDDEAGVFRIFDLYSTAPRAKASSSRTASSFVQPWRRTSDCHVRNSRACPTTRRRRARAPRLIGHARRSRSRTSSR